MAFSEGDFVKSRSRFATFHEADSSFTGSLTTLESGSMYSIKLSAANTLPLVGPPIAADAPVPITAGWNWLPFLPLEVRATRHTPPSCPPRRRGSPRAPLPCARLTTGPRSVRPQACPLATLPTSSFSEGDMIKSRTAFATFYPGYGWYGPLVELTPGMGYMLWANKTSTLYYS